MFCCVVTLPDKLRTAACIQETQFAKHRNNMCSYQLLSVYHYNYVDMYGTNMFCCITILIFVAFLYPHLILLDILNLMCN